MDSKPIQYRNTFIKTLVNTTKMPFLKIRTFKDLFPQNKYQLEQKLIWEIKSNMMN